MGAGLYIHVPFCHSKCSYCDFYSMPLRKEIENMYVDTLLKEWQMRKDEIDAPISTLYLGGGTPSILSDTNLNRLIQGLDIDIASLSEVTIEANPEDITPQKVEAFKASGIRRVSMGIQSLDDTLLETIGRRHNSLSAIKAYENLRKGGIDNISLDLMYGLPTQSLIQWENTLHTMLEIMHPEHLSAYILSFEPGTRMTAMRDAGKLTAPDEDLIIEMYTILCMMARDRGYVHYEISNFSLPGYEARHNSAYWNMSPYIGLGPGAHSFDGKSTRRSNPWNINRYISCISADSIFCETEEEDANTIHNDIVMTSLRTSRGLDMLRWHKYAAQWMRVAHKFIAEGTMKLTGHRLALTEKAWLMADDYISHFLIVD